MCVCLCVYACVTLTFVSNKGVNRLDIRFLVGLLHHAEPILQILKALVVGDIVNQENPLHWKKKHEGTMLTLVSPLRPLGGTYWT